MERDERKKLDLVLKSGRILMESGAEIYRTEETMNRMANAFHLKDFEAYVMNRGIMASYLTKEGYSESKVVVTNATSIHLKKIEEVNTLSRYITSHSRFDMRDLEQRFRAIDQHRDYSQLTNLLAYFFGAAGFTLALGSSWMDSLIAAVSGLFLGLGMQLVQRFVTTDYLITIIGSGLITLFVNLFAMFGMGDSKNLILLGTLMLLVPGVAFVNAIREFSQTHISVGTSLFISALLISSSISVGVSGMTALLPFAQQLSGHLPAMEMTGLSTILKTLAAGVGTVAFAVFYNVSKRYFFELGLIGALSWLIYLVLIQVTAWEGVAVFLSALFVAFASQILAVYKRCPATIFLASSMIPLIPGLSVYRTVYFLLVGNLNDAMIYLRTAFVAAFAIAIAIGIAQQVKMNGILHYLIRRRTRTNR